MTLRNASAWGALVMAVSLGGCAYNEELGRSQFLLVDNSDLAQQAAQAWAQTLSQGRVSTDPAHTSRVRAVANRLVAAAGLSDRPWEIVVFNNDAANAFVLPGGQIGVNTGLLTIVENDDQLAAVIGHKIAHMTANHSAERYSQTAATQVVLAGAQTALGGSASRSAQAVGALGGAGAQLGVLLPFSRRHELEADRIGVDYMVRAGYRADQSVRLWTNMTAGRGGGATGGFLSTHPSDQQRIAALQAHITARGYR